MAAVLLIGAAVVAAVLLTPRPSDPQTAGADPTAAPPATEPPATASPEAVETQRPRPAGRRVNLDALARQVAAIRGLPIERRIRSRVLSGPDLADKVSELAFSEMDADQVAADERLLVALHLAPSDIDLAAILEDLYREQILGLYVPQERTLFVKGGRERGSPAQRLTSAHEITHALQDQSFDLFAMQEAVKDDPEASLGLLSLIEGDAVLTQELWSQQHQTPAERQQAIAESQTGGQALAKAPDYLRAGLFFPYEAGSRFVAALFTAGGFAAVDAAFADPPTTSEQILHPEKYQAGETAADIRVRPRPGAGWEHSTTYPFGEFDLRELFSVLGQETATVAGEGWGGGQVRSWERGDDTAVGIALTFDSAQDAAEVCDAFPQWYAGVAQGREVGDGLHRGARDHLALRCTQDSVHVGIAPQGPLARRLAGRG